MDTLQFWLNAAVYTVLLLLSIYLVFRNIVLRRRLSDGGMEYLKLALESAERVKFLTKEIEKRDKEALTETDGFVKFLSESRDWAFKYIEDVQAAILELKEAKESGDRKKIKSSTDKLYELLPKENKEK